MNGQKDSVLKNNAYKRYNSGEFKHRINIDKHILDAINTVFALLEKASVTKFRQAFPEQEAIYSAKQSWMLFLKDFSPERIVFAAKKAIHSTKYYPDLIEILKHCRFSFEELGLKSAVAAYKEACLHTETTTWSHQAIKLATEQTGWHALRTEAEKIIFPIFKRNYLNICEQLQNGKSLDIDRVKTTAISHKSLKEKTDLVAKQQQQQILKQQQIDGLPTNIVRTKLLEEITN